MFRLDCLRQRRGSKEKYNSLIVHWQHGWMIFTQFKIYSVDIIITPVIPDLWLHLYCPWCYSCWSFLTDRSNLYLRKNSRVYIYLIFRPDLFTLVFTWCCHHLCEIFRNGLDKVRSRHENRKSANDGKEGEGHQTQPVHYCRGKLPFATDGLSLVLVPESLGYVRHFLQDALDLWWWDANSYPQASGTTANDAGCISIITGRAVNASA